MPAPAAVSVLTEPLHFDGSLDDLIAVQDAVAVPVLRKDFLLDPAQVFEARAAGADAVLLIVAALGADVLGRMIAAAAEAGIDALVEVHDLDEAAIARAAGATLIGVNNRNLETFVHRSWCCGGARRDGAGGGDRHGGRERDPHTGRCEAHERRRLRRDPRWGGAGCCR